MKRQVMTIGQSTSDDNWSEHNQKENIKTKMQKSKKGIL